MSDGLPYAPVSPTERRRRAQELLARHARAWDAQLATFTTQQPKNSQHHSNLQVDAEWREKQRALARADANSRAQYEISWQNSLRTNERVVELKLGKVNPVSFFRKDTNNLAINNILQMPAYVPISEKLPHDLLQKNYDSLQNHLQQIECPEDTDEIELPLQNSPSSEEEESEIQQENEQQNVQVVKNKFQSMIPAGANAQKADEIARKITKNSNKVKVQRMDLNKINKQAIIEPLDSIQTHIRPRVLISNLTVISSENTQDSNLKMKNIGDCSFMIQIKQRNQITQNAKKEIIRKEVNDESTAGPSMNDIDAVSQRPSQVAPGSPASILGKLKTAKFTSNTQQFNITKKPIIQAPTESVGSGQKENQIQRDDMAQKMLEKSSTPSHLRILANRCVQNSRGEMESKIIVATKGAKWLCGSGESSNIEFIVPNNKQQQPGIILQEYELVFVPAVEVEFENRDDQKSGQNSVIQTEGSTSVFIRCYGIQSWCLQLKKQIETLNNIGQGVVEKIYNQNVCQEILYSLSDESVNISIHKNKEVLEKEDIAQSIKKKIESTVIQTYQNKVVKAKWLIDKEIIKQFLYDLITEESGYNMSVLDIFDNYYDFDAHTRFEEVGNEVFEFLDSIDTTQVQAYPFIYLQFAKNSIFINRAKSLSKVILKHQYLFQNIEIFDKFRINSCQIVRKRLLALISDENAEKNIIINQTSDSEMYLMQKATRGTIINAALFSEFKPSKIVNLLINKLVNEITLSVNKQVKFDKTKQYSVNEQQQIFANKRPIYDGNLINLLYLTAAVSNKKPVWDIFNILNKVQDETLEERKLQLLELLMLKSIIFDVEIQVNSESDNTIRSIIGKAVNQKIIDQKLIVEQQYDFMVDNTKLFVPKYTIEQLNNLIQLIKANSTLDNEQFLEKFTVEEISLTIVPDLVFLLTREFLYSQTMKHRVFLKLYYLETANINDMDPFNILTLAEKIILTQNLNFTTQNFAQLYYNSVFTPDLYQQALEKLMIFQPATPNKGPKATKPGKDTVKIINLAPIQSKLRLLKQFNFSASTFTGSVQEALIQAHVQISAEQPQSSSKQKRDPKQVDFKPLTLLTSLNHQYFTEFSSNSLFSTSLQLFFKDQYEFSKLQNQPLDKISYSQMLIDVVSVIFSISASPKIDAFDNYKLENNEEQIELIQQNYQEKREKLLNDICDLCVIPEQPPPKKGGKSSVEFEVPITDTKQLRTTVINNLSNVIFYPQSSLVQEVQQQEFKPRELGDNQSSLILASMAELPTDFQFDKPVKKFGGSMNLSTFDASEIKMDEETDHKNATIKESGYCTSLPEKYDVAHQIRIQAFRHEFDIFIDSLFTELTSEAIVSHNENVSNFDIDLDDFETTKSKMEQLKTGELTYEQAGIEPEDFVEPAEMVPPEQPLPSFGFKDIIEQIELIEKKLMIQSDLIFCKGTDISILQSLAYRIFDCIYQAYLKYCEQAQVVLENEFNGSECENSAKKLLFDCGENLGISIEKYGIDVRIIKGLEEVNKHPTILIEDMDKNTLFNNIQTYYKAFGIRLEIDQQINEYHLKQAQELIPSYQIQPFSIIPSFKPKYVNNSAIDSFLYQNPDKHTFKSIPQIFLLSDMSIFNQHISKVENLENFLEVTQENAKNAFDVLGCHAPVKDKKKDDKNKPIEHAPEKVEEDAEGEEEEEDEDEIKIPGYLKEVEPETQSKRDVWGFLFNQCLERSSCWFSAADKIALQFEKGLNYVSRDWKELYDQ
ncbi:hypothetical protein SS50377_25274 [Spironucleus salmonicida]|uniref:Uncharacterized protein n=1 Tax=Spironucleus salmonicida TaxID=348837 RepID=V6LBK3_9EUKA|nr:hypothetical protein SS50377_25274 [Spironucleus salmonicida]|eukprot:EST41845.1 hypothetical protein SS50377_18679 [Spironucleus salmonicida]